ncbi:aspartyl protease family protein [Ruegeria sp. Ofav3-42]|uniref:aspartyl protease family protein n=1 Tax=Ruegeria sp. Ofav3-42 TaxID=2917759 RepID=UPI00351CCA47
MVGLSAPHSAALTRQGKTPPIPVLGTFLVDTGASGTCVDPGLVAPLGLTPTGSVDMQTPSTNGKPVSCPLYDASLIVPNGTAGTLPFVIDALPVMETTLRPQGIDGLIGRDFLSQCVLICNGPTTIMTICY